MPEATRKNRRGGFFAVLWRELGIMGRSPFYVLFIVVFPVLSMAVVWAVLSERVPRDMPVVVRDGDQSALSRQLIRMVDASPSIAVAATVEDVEAAERYLREGRAYALIFVPADMGRDLRRGESPEISVYYNNQWLLCGGVILRSLRTVTGTLSAGLDIRKRMLQEEHPAEARERYEPIHVESHPLFNPHMSYFQFLVPPVIIALIQVFILMVTVRTVGVELKRGTAQAWLDTAGNRAWLALLGKLFPYTLAFLALSAGALFVLFRFGGIPNNSTPWVLIAGTLLFVLAYQSVGVLFVALTANLRLSNSLAGFYGGPAFAFAGITYPLLGIPLAVKIYSYALPLTHYIHLFFEQAYRGSPAQTSASGLLALMAFVLLPPILFLPRLARCMRDSRYWGKL